MHSDLKQIDLDKIDSFKTLLAQLVALDTLLPKHELEQFIVFNKAYLAVSTKIKQAVDEDYFDNPKFIEKFTVHFARYYFRALNETWAESADLPVAWKKLNQVTTYNDAPNFMPLLMGANAHINHDLPLVLLELVAKEKTDELLKDVFKIDKLLMKAGKEIIGFFDESNKLLDFLKRNFVFLYYRPTMYVVLYWRVRTWQDYKAIKKDGVENSNYQKRSVRIANRFLMLARLLG